jgi:hypothetical protein
MLYNFKSTPLLNKILFSKGCVWTTIYASSAAKTFSATLENSMKPQAIGDYNTCMDCAYKNG